MHSDAATPSPRTPRIRTERRMGERFAPRRLLTGQIEPEEGESVSASVQNLSARGIALLARRPFAPGTLLKVRLVNAASTYSLIVRVRVAHCTAVLTGDHYMGCEFEQALSPDEVGPFLT